MIFANGRIPSAFLVQAANGTPGQLLEAQTAAQWSAMVSAAARDGIYLRPQSEDDGIPSCYRSYDAQVWTRANATAPAAYPGTSNHGNGTAIDIYMGPGVKAWLDANAARFGFDWSQGRADGEPWHWVRTVTIAGMTNTIEDDMPDMNTFLNTPAYTGGPTISAFFKAINEATFVGGASMKDSEKSISQSLAEIHAVVAQPVQGRDRGDGRGQVSVSQIQDNADTNTIVRQLLSQVGALSATVNTLSAATGADPAAIQAAAKAGAEEALKNLTLVPVTK